MQQNIKVLKTRDPCLWICVLFSLGHSNAGNSAIVMGFVRSGSFLFLYFITFFAKSSVALPFVKWETINM